MPIFTLDYCRHSLEDEIIALPDPISDGYELALFPLHTVLFPTTFIPLRIFEPRYVDLVGRCMQDNAAFGIIAILDGAETGRPARTHDVGTVARIVDFDQGADGLLNIVVRGDGRFRLHGTSIRTDNLLVGRAADLSDVAERSVPDEFQYLADLLQEILENDKIAQNRGPAPAMAAPLAYTLAQLLPLTLAEKITLLETENPLELLERLSHHVRPGQRVSE